MAISGDAVIGAVLAKVGDPDAIRRRAASIDVKDTADIPRAIRNKLAKRYALLGQAVLASELTEFLRRLAAEIENQKQQKKVSESQLKSPTSIHIRRQSAFPSSINRSKSFGGVVDGAPGTTKSNRPKKKTGTRALKERLDAITEEVGLVVGKNALAAERGRFIVDGKVAIDNHADILKVLVMWFLDHNPEVLKIAINDIAESIRSGAVFR